MIKKEGLGKRFWTAIAVIGIVICSLTGVVAYEIGNTRVSDRTNNINDYIKTQSLAYDSINNAAAMRSQVRAAENASQIALDISNGTAVLTTEMLHQRAKDLHMTGVFVLNAKGELMASYSDQTLYFADIKSDVCNKTALEVATHGDKIYTTRVELDDGSLVDIACAKRLDEPGVVTVAFRSTPDYIARYTITLQSLLNGYNVETNGSIVIEKNNEPIAANINTSSDPLITRLEPEDMAVLQTIKDECELGELKLIHSGTSNYLASYDNVRDYYIFYFTETSMMFVSLFIAIGVVALIYICCAIFYALRHRKTEALHLSTLIAQESEYNKRLEKAAEDAQRANDSKTQFLRRMSHDIRTPINGIRGMVEVGNAYRDNLAKQDECREKIWNASGMLLDLVNESLDMSKLESGEITLDIQTVSLTKLITETCDMLMRQAESRTVSFKLVEPKLEHPMVKTSAVHFKRMLMNIAGNAIKYNKPNGEVLVTCDEVSFDGSKSTVRLVIADTGIGMSDEFKKTIFEPFSREQQDCGFKPNGTGLGASIAKNLCECLGGTLEFESELGVGTTFTLTMPFEVAETTDSSSCAPEAASEAESLDGLNIMLVEDNELNREIALFHLMQAGANVTCAIDGHDALETFEASAENAFDIILMDIMMPDMNGYEVAETIRSMTRPDAKSVPIVALSANAFSDDIAHAREVGMNGHLAKPIDVHKLIELIASLTSRS